MDPVHGAQSLERAGTFDRKKSSIEMPTIGPAGRRPQKPETQAQPVEEHEPGQPSREPDRSPPEPWRARITFIGIVSAIAAALIVGVLASGT